MRKYIVLKINQGNLGRFGFGDVVLETDSLTEASAAAGVAGPFGGAVVDSETGLTDVGNGWQTDREAKDWLNTE